MSPDFWTAIEQLVADHPIVLDRPQGQPHPRYPEIIYPLDYGFLEGTMAVDGEGVDVWLGSGNRSEVTSVICTVDLYKKDVEIKVLLGCSAAETQTILDFLRANEMACTLMERPARTDASD